jgi:two-component system LytT family sensor kinase
MVLLVATAVAAALMIHVVGNVVRFEMLERYAGELGWRGGGRGGGRFGPRGGPWRIDRFGIVNELVTAGGLVAAAIARNASLRYRARREQATRLQAQLAEARLDALRRQLDPHFLFNTLNAVSALVERDPRGVRRMIARLSELLRHSMEGGEDAEIPLERELALLQLYVDIMMVRFQGRLEVTMSADDRARTALVPQLVLQPLVENAIRHGVSQVDGEGRIAVMAAVEGGTLRLRVQDNGRGVIAPGEDATADATADAADVRTSGGVGLRNTRARLAQLYGDAHRIALEPAPGGGTVAELVIPFHTEVMAPLGGVTT